MKSTCYPNLCEEFPHCAHVIRDEAYWEEMNEPINVGRASDYNGFWGSEVSDCD